MDSTLVLTGDVGVEPVHQRNLPIFLPSGSKNFYIFSNIMDIFDFSF